MRIAVTAEAAGADAAPCERFGRSPHLVVHDTEREDWTSTPNPGARAERGAGVEAARHLVAQHVDVLLTGRVGPNAREVLDAAGVRVVDVEGATVREAIERHARGDLTPLSPAEGGAP